MLFSDFVGFTSISETMPAEELVNNLDIYFRAFDEIISKYELEKIKTIGDAYMCAGGLPTPSTTHSLDTVRAGLEICNWVNKRFSDVQIDPKFKWQVRIGIHSGSVIAGVVGDKKFAYDIWGDTVNTASRMESHGLPGMVNISESTYRRIKDNSDLSFQSRGNISVKGKGKMPMWIVMGNE